MWISVLVRRCCTTRLFLCGGLVLHCNVARRRRRRQPNPWRHLERRKKMRSTTLRTKMPLQVRLGLKIQNIFQKGLLRVGTNTMQSRNPRMWLLSTATHGLRHQTREVVKVVHEDQGCRHAHSRSTDAENHEGATWCNAGSGIHHIRSVD